MLDNFGAEYATAPAFDVPYPAKQCNCTTAAVDHLREQIATLEEALREAWRVFDLSGAYQSDDDKLAVLSGHAFFVGGVQGPHGNAQGSEGASHEIPATMPGPGDACTWPAFAMFQAIRGASNGR